MREVVMVVFRVSVGSVQGGGQPLRSFSKPRRFFLYKQD